jgi:CRP-like cAMP-binding protein
MTGNNGSTDLVALFRDALGFKGLDDSQISEIAEKGSLRRFHRGEFIFREGDPCRHFQLVASGLVKVSICASSGKQITYLLAVRGEPLNLVGPFTGSPRFLSAEAMKESSVVFVRREAFTSFAFKYPRVVINIISILGRALDSANSRIMDITENRVEERVLRVLHTLFHKFGPTLRFTSTEIAELAGTTTESTLRSMGRLRELGLIGSGRGEITILDPAKVAELSSEALWL